MTRVHSKSSNRLYRLDTDQGSFAVKELNLVDRRWTYHADDVFRFEQAAFAAGIPMPEPISADPGVLVHRWVEGDKLPEAPVPAAFAFEIGEILARIHALDVQWTHVSIEDPTPRDWPELAEQAAATGQPWADELASHVAKGPGFDDIEPIIFRSVLDGYVAEGGALPPSGPSWFVFMIEGWLGFTRWNIVRCLAGVEPPTGPDLTMGHEEVRNGLHGLPDMFGRLPELEDLLV
jgi:hypothetical protein